MTDREFCENETSFSGEHMDKVEQISQYNFSGRELKEYVEFHIQQTKGKILSEHEIEEIYDALRLTINIYKCKNKETAYDRTVMRAFSYIEKLK